MYNRLILIVFLVLSCTSKKKISVTHLKAERDINSHLKYCDAPIETVHDAQYRSHPPYSFYKVDFSCIGTRLVVSHFDGNEADHYANINTFVQDYTPQDSIMYLAFNTNFSVLGGEEITGAYVKDGEIYQNTYLVDGNFTQEHTRHSIGIDNHNILFQVSIPESVSDVVALNSSIKNTVAEGGIIPAQTKQLISGIKLNSKDMPAHGGRIDPYSAYLGHRNVMGVIREENKLVVGLLQDANRNYAHRIYSERFGINDAIFFDGGGSTKQYVAKELTHTGSNRTLMGDRKVPSIAGILFTPPLDSSPLQGDVQKPLSFLKDDGKLSSVKCEDAWRATFFKGTDFWDSERIDFSLEDLSNLDNFSYQECVAGTTQGEFTNQDLGDFLPEFIRGKHPFTKPESDFVQKDLEPNYYTVLFEQVVNLEAGAYQLNALYPNYRAAVKNKTANVKVFVNGQKINAINLEKHSSYGIIKATNKGSYKFSILYVINAVYMNHFPEMVKDFESRISFSALKISR